MANDCEKHAGKHNEVRRTPLDKMMSSLPENQSGGGRHKCPYCAYERGFEDGLKSAVDKFRRVIMKSPAVD